MLILSQCCHSRVIDYKVLLGCNLKIKACYFQLIASKTKGMLARGLVLAVSRDLHDCIASHGSQYTSRHTLIYVLYKAEKLSVSLHGST